jgi:predicted Fe-Mo cluster-binding NifX family protein
MKICIATTGKDLDSSIDQIFGRCSYFLFVDSETQKFEAVTNKAKESERGAGIAASQTVVDSKCEAVICGKIGPNAQMVLEKSGIKIISGISGTAKDALDKLKKQ